MEIPAGEEQAGWAAASARTQDLRTCSLLCTPNKQFSVPSSHHSVLSAASPVSSHSLPTKACYLPQATRSHLSRKVALGKTDALTQGGSAGPFAGTSKASAAHWLCFSPHSAECPVHSGGSRAYTCHLHVPPSVAGVAWGVPGPAPLLIFRNSQ